MTISLRLLDLVRHQRAELFEAGLISEAEYASLATIDGSVERLESYDEIRRRHKRETAESYTAGYKAAELKHHNFRTQVWSALSGTTIIELSDVMVVETVEAVAKEAGK